MLLAVLFMIISTVLLIKNSRNLFISTLITVALVITSTILLFINANYYLAPIWVALSIIWIINTIQANETL